MEPHICGERYHQLFDTTPSYITVQNRDFDIVDFNRRFEDDFGAPDGRKCYQAYKQRAEVCETCPVARAFEDGRVHQSEEIVTTREGKTCYVLVHASPILNEDGNVEEVMEVATNITELKDLQSRMATVGRLVSRLAHTVKGIVMSLDGGMYVLDTGFKEKREEDIQKGWKIVQRNIGRVSSLVLDMLEYAKDRDPEYAPVELAHVIKEVTDLYETKFLRLGITLRLELQPVKPVMADERQIHGMLISLLENAVDACKWDPDQGQHAIAIRLRPAKRLPGDMVVIEVEDDGIGMDQDTRERLFTPMFSTKRGGGTGLGLLVVKKVVKEHGGLVDVVSSPGEGANFRLALPVEGPPRSEEQAEEEAKAKPLEA